MKTEELSTLLRNSLNTIFREPEGLLRHPYIDPGSVYGKNIWDWDSFWSLKTALAMAEDPEQNADWRAKVIRHSAGVLDNFFDHQGEDGSLPILMTPEDTDLFDSTTEPANNMAKPVFGQLMAARNRVQPDPESCARWCEALTSFYHCFDTRYRDSCGLYVWANDIAIGADDDPSTWGRPPFSSANLLLNNLLYMDLKAAASVAETIGQPELAQRWNVQADQLAICIQTLCWDERDGFFYSVDVQCRQRTQDHRYFKQLNANLKPDWAVLPFKILYWTGFLPMWSGIATPEQATRMVEEHLLRADRFWAEYGVRTLSADERMYDPETIRGNPSNWLGPIWMISNYLVWAGLKRYGFEDVSNKLARRTHKLMGQDLQKTGHWHENYHPDTGVGLAAPGFVSWNVLLYFLPLKHD